MRKRRWETDIQDQESEVENHEEPVIEESVDEEIAEEDSVDEEEDDGTRDYSFQSYSQQYQKRTNIAVIVSICTFAIILTGVITAVMVTLHSSKKEPMQEPVIAQSEESISEQAAAVHESIGLSSEFPTRDLNANDLPNYNYTESMYSQYFSYISEVSTSSSITESDKASVVETFVCYMVMTGWNDPSHILNIRNRQDDWYFITDETFSMDFWVNPTKNVVYQQMWNLTADQLYIIDCQVCNQYGAINISYSVNEPYNGKVTVDCWDYDTEFVFNLEDLEVLEIISGIPE